MEMLLRRRGERLETAPIKGTRPRTENGEEDRRLAVELASDPKERAELAMNIVWRDGRIVEGRPDRQPSLSRSNPRPRQPDDRSVARAAASDRSQDAFEAAMGPGA